MHVKHKFMPDDFPGIDCGKDIGELIILVGPDKAHRYAMLGVAERLRQTVAKVKSKGEKLTEEQIEKLLELKARDLIKLPPKPYEKAVADLAALSPEERAAALADLKKRLGTEEKADG